MLAGFHDDRLRTKRQEILDDRFLGDGVLKLVEENLHFVEFTVQKLLGEGVRQIRRLLESDLSSEFLEVSTELEALACASPEEIESALSEERKSHRRIISTFFLQKPHGGLDSHGVKAATES